MMLFQIQTRTVKDLYKLNLRETPDLLSSIYMYFSLFCKGYNTPDIISAEARYIPNHIGSRFMACGLAAKRRIDINVYDGIIIKWKPGLTETEAQWMTVADHLLQLGWIIDLKFISIKVNALNINFPNIRDPYMKEVAICISMKPEMVDYFTRMCPSTIKYMPVIRLYVNDSVDAQATNDYGLMSAICHTMQDYYSQVIETYAEVDAQHECLVYNIFLKKGSLKICGNNSGILFMQPEIVQDSVTGEYAINDKFFRWGNAVERERERRGRHIE